MIFWTHIFDLLAKLLSIFLAIFLVIVVTGVIDGYPEIAFYFMVPLLFILYFGVFRTLSSLLYCSVILKMPVRFSQARELNRALSPLLSMRWLTLKEVLAYPPEQRYRRALGIVQTNQH
ncbi:MAG: hypothetical protein IPK50_06180 [Fibrobacterota bacterium]|nr:MAG: hypothetical protein IPK50_06180 [Fibrobacterota bacterium]